MKSFTHDRKAAIRMYLEEIVQTTKLVDALMEKASHPNGLARQSLSYAKESILHDQEGFSATYRANDGAVYRIRVEREPAQKSLPFI